MKSNNFFLGVFISCILFSSCQKEIEQDQNPTTPAPVTVNADGSLNVADANGAFYTVLTKSFNTNNSTTYDEIHMAYAWAGKFPAVVNAGIIKANNIEVANMSNFYMTLSVLPFMDTLFKGTNYNTIWSVQGNTTSGVPPFSHTDNSIMPAGPAFTLPAGININNNLTVSHTSTGGALGVLYTLTGDNGDTTKFVAKTSSSITFTSSEVKSVAISNSAVVLSIMPIGYSTATYAGKKYYFVKQYQYVRETATL